MMLDLVEPYFFSVCTKSPAVKLLKLHERYIIVQTIMFFSCSINLCNIVLYFPIMDTYLKKEHS